MNKLVYQLDTASKLIPLYKQQFIFYFSLITVLVSTIIMSFVIFNYLKKSSEERINDAFYYKCFFFISGELYFIFILLSTFDWFKTLYIKGLSLSICEVLLSYVFYAMAQIPINTKEFKDEKQKDMSIIRYNISNAVITIGLLVSIILSVFAKDIFTIIPNNNFIILYTNNPYTISYCIICLIICIMNTKGAPFLLDPFISKKLRDTRPLMILTLISILTANLYNTFMLHFSNKDIVLNIIGAIHLTMLLLVFFALNIPIFISAIYNFKLNKKMEK